MLLAFSESALLSMPWLLISTASSCSAIGGYGNIDMMLYPAPSPLAMLGS
jgi:hypothetical protein